MIQWPVVVKYQGVDELAYVSSDTVWQQNVDFYAFSYNANDFMVDTIGRKYQLLRAADGSIVADDTGDNITLQEYGELIQRHAATLGECCIEKIQLRNITDGFIFVKSTREKQSAPSSP